MLQGGIINNNCEEKNYLQDFKADLCLLRRNNFLSILKHIRPQKVKKLTQIVANKL